MRKIVNRLALLSLLALLLPTIAGAQTPMREFKGKVDKKNKREMIVDNRMGDKLKFKFVDETEVTGEKDNLKRVKKGDWVIVSWKMMDNPRIAYKINVIPEVSEEGEDVD
jgi:hypothetical protein